MPHGSVSWPSSSKTQSAFANPPFAAHECATRSFAVKNEPDDCLHYDTERCDKPFFADQREEMGRDVTIECATEESADSDKRATTDRLRNGRRSRA